LSPRSPILKGKKPNNTPAPGLCFFNAALRNYIKKALKKKLKEGMSPLLIFYPRFLKE